MANESVPSYGSQEVAPVVSMAQNVVWTHPVFKESLLPPSTAPHQHLPGIGYVPAFIPSPIPATVTPPNATLLSNTGFDLVAVLTRIATRLNPTLPLGPIDASCTFVVASAEAIDFPVIYASESFCAMTGYALGEILGRNCRFLQSPDGRVTPGSRRKHTDNDAVYTMKSAVVEAREVQVVVMNYKKSGAPFMNLVTIIPLMRLDGSNRVEMYVGLQVDMMEQSGAILNKMGDGMYVVDFRRAASMRGNRMGRVGVGASMVDTTTHGVQNRARKELMDILIRSGFVSPQTSKDSLGQDKVGELANRLLLQEAPDFVHVITLKGQMIYVNEGIRRVLGYEPEEMTGKGLKDICHPSDLAPVLREIREVGLALSNGKSESRASPTIQSVVPFHVYTSLSTLIGVLYRAKRKDGRWIWIEAKGRVMVEPGRSRRCAVLCGRERHVPRIPTQLVRASGGCSVNEFWSKLSCEGLYLHVGVRCQELLGIPPEVLRGTSIYQFAKPAYVPAITKGLTLVLEHGSIVRLRHQLLGQQGIEMEVESVLLPGHVGDDIVEREPREFVLSRTRVLGEYDAVVAAKGGSGKARDAMEASTGSAPEDVLGILKVSATDLVAPGAEGSDALAAEDWFAALGMSQTNPWHVELHRLNSENTILKAQLFDLEQQRKQDEARQLALVMSEKKQGAKSMPHEDMKACGLCGATTSPEWRRGPDGPKTLCNSCGLRYGKAVREGKEGELLAQLKQELMR